MNAKAKALHTIFPLPAVDEQMISMHLKYLTDCIEAKMNGYTRSSHLYSVNAYHV